jgi:LysM repeat protein
MVQGCETFYLVVAGDGCWAIANQNDITLDDFYAWNPAIGKDCAKLQPDYYVCIGRKSTTSPSPTSKPTTTSQVTTTLTSKTSSATATRPAPPGPTQSGVAANCNKWVLQKDGVYCYDMAQAAGIALDKLYALNPALNGDCSGLWPGYAYCIGAS